jgi:hypothetical protein
MNVTPEHSCNERVADFMAGNSTVALFASAWDWVL